MFSCSQKGSLANLGPHDFPALALQDLVHSTVEYLTIGMRDVKAKGVIVRGDHLASDFKAGCAKKTRKYLAGVVLDGPGGGHGTVPKASDQATIQ